jgi:alpha-1,4-N-acetylglucosaminyltransferase EXTL3
VFAAFRHGSDLIPLTYLQGLGGVDPPEWLDLNAYKVPVYLSRARVNSLTERFVRPKEMRTDAGLWIDDDLQIHPEDIEFGFTTYEQLGRMNHRITGYSGRQTLLDKKNNNKYSYEIKEPNYSMVLTNSAFMDTQMLKWFWNTRDERIKESIKYVDDHMNCEDILMNCKSFSPASVHTCSLLTLFS